MGLIYKITNNANGKCYIGKTSLHLDTRINDHFSGKGSKMIARAMQKYGQSNFTVEVIHDGVFDIFLDELEIKEIAKHNSVAPNGYNLTFGGEGGRKSDDVKKQIANTLKGKYTGEKNPNWGKRKSKAYNHEEEICKMYKEGSTIKQIQVFFNTSQDVIGNILDKHGISKKIEVWSHQQEICESYLDHGVSMKVLAREYGASQHTIKRILIDNDIDIKSRSDACKKSSLWEHQEQIIDMYAHQKMTVIDIAKHFGENDAAVHRVLEFNNISKMSLSDALKIGFRNRVKHTHKVWHSVCEIARLYFDEGKSSRDIAKMYNVSRGTIQKIIKKISGQSHARKSKVWQYEQEIIDMFMNNGKTPCQIGYRLGFCHKSIKRVLAENGLWDK